MDKQVLITGSSRGIGKATALYLARLGYNIVLHCNANLAEAEKVKSEIETNGGYARVLQFDVNNRELCAEVLLKDIEEFEPYYGVVCNAGISADNSFPIMTGEEWDKVVNTSLNGFYNVIQPIIMEMIGTRKAGRIITMSSVSGLMGNRGQVNYSAAKAGVIGATKALAMELARHKITVNSVAPGLIETDMTKDLDVEEMKKYIPMRRVGKPEEVAAAVAFLLSEEAAYITKQVISINGGLF